MPSGVLIPPPAQRRAATHRVAVFRCWIGFEAKPFGGFPCRPKSEAIGWPTAACTPVGGPYWDEALVGKRASRIAVRIPPPAPSYVKTSERRAVLRPNYAKASMGEARLRSGEPKRKRPGLLDPIAFRSTPHRRGARAFRRRPTPTSVSLRTARQYPPEGSSRLFSALQPSHRPDHGAL